MACWKDSLGVIRSDFGANVVANWTMISDSDGATVVGREEEMKGREVVGSSFFGTILEE